MSAISPRPIADARVCLWQADSVGYYSGYLSKDPDSFATPPLAIPFRPATARASCVACSLSTSGESRYFRTIYPGWYYARCPHIHIKVHAGGKDLYTGELFLPEEWNKVIQKLLPCNQHTTLERLPNSDDVTYQMAGGHDTLVSPTPMTPGQPELGLTGSITVAVAGS